MIGRLFALWALWRLLRGHVVHVRTWYEREAWGEDPYTMEFDAITFKIRHEFGAVAGRWGDYLESAGHPFGRSDQILRDPRGVVKVTGLAA